MTPRPCLAPIAAFLCMAAVSGMAETTRDTVYRIAPLTTLDVTLENDTLRQHPSVRMLLLALEPVDIGRSIKYAHYMPSLTGEAESINLSVRPLSFIDVDLARQNPFEHPFRRVLVYWGCGDDPTRGQPKATLFHREDDAHLSVRLAPRPLESGRARSLPEVPPERRLMAPEDMRFPEHLRLRGSRELRRDDRVTRFEVHESGDFLEPPEITRLGISDKGSIRVEWKRRPGIAAYFISAYVQHKLSPDVVIWTSSRLAEAGWIL